MRVTIDLHRTSRSQLDDELRRLELDARRQLGQNVEVRYRRFSDQHFEVEFTQAGAPVTDTHPLVLTSAPLSTNTLQGLAQFDRELAKNVDEIRKDRKMAGPAAVADRLRALKKSISDESDKLIAEIDGVNSTQVPNAFAKGHQLLAGQKAELDGLEAELNQLTNLDLSDPTASGGSPKS